LPDFEAGSDCAEHDIGTAKKQCQSGVATEKTSIQVRQKNAENHRTYQEAG
jgi:hypothetical protein